MGKLLKKNISLISFIFVPVIFLWHPNWLGILGIQPYWPLFWLLPWSMLYGKNNGLITGLLLGLTLDSISVGNGFSQIPGLIICGFWFGRITISSNALVGHFKNGLICALGSLLCGILMLFQIFVKSSPDNSFLLIFPGIRNILAQVFLTGIYAPLICSQLYRFFKSTKEKNIT